MLQFNQVFTPLNVLVVKTLSTDFILGADWCTQNAVHIDYDKNQVSIRSPNRRLFISYDKSIDYLTLDVKLINTIKIPPHESCTVQAKVELSSADTVHFHPDDSIQLEKSVLISPSLLHIDNYTTYLEMHNPNDYIITLFINTLLGQVTHTPSQVQSFTVFDSPGDLSLLSSSRNTTINNITLQPTSLPTTQTIDKLTDHIAHPQAKQQLRCILQQHAKVFDTSHVTQANTPIQHTINTGDALPISSRPYPRTIQQRRELQDQIQNMVQTKQIRPSNSPWSSPVILHKKKGGTIRFLVD